jgi:hypothetical protein
MFNGTWWSGEFPKYTKYGKIRANLTQYIFKFYKAPFIVFPSADLDKAVAGLMASKVSCLNMRALNN